MSLSKLLPHSHLILYLIGISLLIIPNFFPHLSQIQARNMKDFIKAAEDDQPLNMAKFSKEGWGADTTNVGQSFYSIEATENTDGTFNYHYGGAVAVLAQGISYIAVVPPATTGEYLADVLKNTHLVPQAYAQGLGFSSLSPILQVWKAFRNVSYFLFIIVFIVVGFMIMFRAQIDQQTVVTIQAALPKLIITLILITFSYAIAGFVVDLIYLVGMGALSILEAAGIISDLTTAANALFGLSIFRIGIKYFISPMEVAGDTANAVSAMVQGLVGLPGGIFDWILDSVFYLAIAIAIFIAMFRTFFGLLSAYIGIIVGVIFAPIQLLTNAFPGSSTFSSWIKNLISNAAVFPAVIIMVVIGAFLAGGDSVASMGITPSGEQRAGFGFGEGGGTDYTGFVPPLITSRGITWVNQGETEEFGPRTIQAIIGLGFIMLLPEVVKIVKGFLKVEEDKYGAQAFENAKRGYGVIRAPFAMVGGAATQVGLSYTAQNIGGWWQKYKAGRAVSKDAAASSDVSTTGERMTHTQYNRLRNLGRSTPVNIGTTGKEQKPSSEVS